MEDDLRWKTTFGGRQPSVKDNIRWKTTFGGRRPSVEDNLQRKYKLLALTREFRMYYGEGATKIILILGVIYHM